MSPGFIIPLRPRLHCSGKRQKRRAVGDNEAEVEVPNIFSNEDSKYETIKKKSLTALEYSTESDKEQNLNFIF